MYCSVFGFKFLRSVPCAINLINAHIQQRSIGMYMDEKRKDGYVTGIICLVIFAIFLPTTISVGWNTSGQIFLGVTFIFGILGAGCLWKPDTIGTVVSQFLRNLNNNSKEESSDSHNKQTQQKSSGIQVMSHDQSKVNIIVSSEKKEHTEETKEVCSSKGCSNEDAERIAIDFVKKKKNPERITVTSVTPATKQGKWEVKGSYPIKIKNGAGSEKFTIEIDKDGNVFSFKFESGAWFALM